MHPTLSRAVIFSLLSLALLLPLAAQPLPHPGEGDTGAAEGPWGHHGRRGHHGFHPRFLARALELTDEQIAAARTLKQEFHADVEPIAQELRAVRAELGEALDAEAPDPRRVGELAIEAHGLRGELRAARELSHERFLALLTREQREKLDRLRRERPARGPRGRGEQDPGDAG